MPAIEIPVIIPHSDADQEKLRQMEREGTLAGPDNRPQDDGTPPETPDDITGIRVVPRPRRAEGVALRGAGDVEGHPFHGNQWTGGSGGTLFHGTSGDRLKAILSEGLRTSHSGERFPDFSKPGVVYTATTREEAEHWASMTIGPDQESELAIVEIRVPDDQASRVAPDPNYTFTGRDGSTFWNADKKIISGDVPKEWIVGAWTARSGRITPRGDKPTWTRVLEGNTALFLVVNVLDRPLFDSSLVTAALHALAPRKRTPPKRRNRYPVHSVADSYAQNFRLAFLKSIDRNDVVDLQSALDAVDRTAAAMTYAMGVVIQATVVASGQLAARGFRAPIRAAGDADQPRDDHGRWVSGSGEFDSNAFSNAGLAIAKGDSHGRKPPADKILASFRDKDGYAIRIIGKSNLELGRKGVMQVQAPDGRVVRGGYFMGFAEPEWDAKEYAKLSWEQKAAREVVQQATAYRPLKEEFEASVLNPRGAEERFELRAAKGPLTGMRFDAVNPKAVQYALEHAAELVTQITDETRKAIQVLIARALSEGIPPKPLGKLLREVIGLTERQGGALVNLREKLIDEGEDPGDIDDEVSAKAGEWMNDRANLVAHTESMKAANMGTQRLWDQAIEDGQLTGKENKEYITTPDERICPICLEMDGQIVGINEPFITPDGEEFEMPPVHPRCRCTAAVTMADALDAVNAPTEDANIDPGDLETFEAYRAAMIKQVGARWYLYSRDGQKILGRHKTEASALAQERAIEWAKRHAEFNPDQERDESGKWTAGGSSYKDTAQGVDTKTVSAGAAAGAQTGKPFDAVLYRGTGSDDPSANRIPSQFAVGEYRTPFPEIAGTYGPKVMSVPTHLENPYVMTLGERAYFQELKKEFGTRDVDAITAKLIAAGHDGLIVKNVPANRGEISMRDSVEVVVFHKRAAEFNPDQERDKSGKWTTGGAEPRVFNTPDDIVQTNDWGKVQYAWKSRPGELLMGVPVDRAALPETLYHVTTNAPAVESSGTLRGQNADAGLGGGQADGVSFTTDAVDAEVIQRELVRAVQIARGEDSGIEAITRYAREDEHAAGLPVGSLDPAVEFARRGYEANSQSVRNTFVWDKEKNEGGYIGPPPPKEEQDRLVRGLTKDAMNGYLMSRDHAYPNVPLLKNPILFGNQDQLAKVDPSHIQVMHVPSANIPARALVTTGSDEFLHEVRAYSDVPIRRLRGGEAEAKDGPTTARAAGTAVSATAAPIGPLRGAGRRILGLVARLRELAFDPAQERDEKGQWVDGGGASAAASATTDREATSLASKSEASHKEMGIVIDKDGKVIERVAQKGTGRSVGYPGTYNARHTAGSDLTAVHTHPTPANNDGGYHATTFSAGDLKFGQEPGVAHMVVITGHGDRFEAAGIKPSAVTVGNAVEGSSRRLLNGMSAHDQAVTNMRGHAMMARLVDGGHVGHYSASFTPETARVLREQIARYPTEWATLVHKSGAVWEKQIGSVRGAEFNPSQERDENGQWTDGGGTAASPDRFVAKEFSFKSLGPERRFMTHPKTGHTVFGGQDHAVTHAEEFAAAKKADPSLPGGFDDYIRGSVDAEHNEIALLHVADGTSYYGIDQAEMFDRVANVLQQFVQAGAGKDTRLWGLDRGGPTLGKAMPFLFKGRRAAEFNPEQARDERGQWTDGGGALSTPEFKAWFGGSKVIGPDGAPLVVYHRGGFNEADQSAPIIGDEGMHFGTKNAADARPTGKSVDDAIKSIVVEKDEETGRYHWSMDGIDSYDLNEEGFDSEDDARSNAEQEATNIGENDEWSEEDVPLTEAYLNISNPVRIADQAGDWTKAIARAKAAGHDGIIYRNQFEDKGSTSYIVFAPQQIKSVRATQFDPSNPLITMMAVDQPRDENGQWTSGDSIPFEAGYFVPGFSPTSMVMFHGTADSNLNSIREHGLIPRGAPGAEAGLQKTDADRVQQFQIGDREGSVFLAMDSQSAQDYAREALKVNPGAKAILLAIQVPSDVRRRGDEFDAQSVRINRAIPPEWIRVVDSTGKLHALEGTTVYAVLIVDEQDARTAMADNQPRDENGQWTSTGLSDDVKRGIEHANQWETTRPWNLTKDELLGGVAGVRYSSALSVEATNRGGKYLVGDKFFALDTDMRRQVLYHELGHDLSDAMLADASAWKLVDDGHMPGGAHVKLDNLDGQTTPGEVIAQAYALLHADSQFIHDRFPVLAAATERKAREMGFPLPSKRSAEFNPDQERDENGRWTGGTTSSPEFKAWFGASKIIDSKGSPLRVFHGTTADISSFDPAHGGEKTGAEDAKAGFFFTDDPKTADEFTWAGGKQSGSIMPVYLRIENPLHSDLVVTAANHREASWVIQDAKAAGHDGVVFRDSDFLGSHGRVFVAFTPTQIKSATGNKGTFDPRNPLITAGDVDQPRDENGRWTGGGTTGGLQRDDVATGKSMAATFYRGTAVGTEESGHAWLTTDRKQAQGYADAAAKRTGTEPVVTEHKVDLTNPLETKSAGSIINASQVPDGHDAVVYWHTGGVASKSNPTPSPRVWAFVKLPNRSAEFNPSQERDENGRWTGGDPQTREYAKIDVFPSDMKNPEIKKAVERVARRCEETARELGVDAGVIHIVYKEPTPFVVGDKQFKEAGHFDPRDGHIEINAQNTNTDRMSLTMGIAAHEVSHLMYNEAQQAQEREHADIKALFDDDRAEFNRLFTVGGYARPETQAEVHERWPVSAMFYKHTGDSYMETEQEARAGVNDTRLALLQKTDGFTEYSQSYWQPAVLNTFNGRGRAIDETLAEVTRYLSHPASLLDTEHPHPVWAAFAKDIMKLHRGRK